jgi:hypothetical protein
MDGEQQRGTLAAGKSRESQHGESRRGEDDVSIIFF